MVCVWILCDEVLSLLQKFWLSIRSKVAGHDLGQNYPIKISSLHGKCTLLKYTALKYPNGVSCVIRSIRSVS